MAEMQITRILRLLPQLCNIPQKELVASQAVAVLTAAMRAMGPLAMGSGWNGADRTAGTGRVSVYQMPKHMKMPLHDHPSMFVFQKILKGSFSIRQFSILQGQQLQLQPFTHGKQASLTCSMEQISLRAGAMLTVTPTHNIHEITALEDDSQFLDVFVPDYCVEGGVTFINGWSQQRLANGQYRLLSQQFIF